MSSRWSNTSVVLSAVASFSWGDYVKAVTLLVKKSRHSGHGTRAQPTGLLQRCTHRLSESTIQPLQRVQNATARLVTDTKPSDHITPVLIHWHWLPKNHEFSTNCASWFTSFTPTSDLPTWPRWSNLLQHLRRGLASGLPVTSCTGSQCWKPSSVSEPSVMPALLPGTVSQTTFSLSPTPNISRNFSKLTCLHRHFNSFIYFIVCHNMKCPPVYFIGRQ